MNETPPNETPAEKPADGLPPELLGWATLNDDKSVTLRLAEPVVEPGAAEPVREIRARRPKGRHMRQLGKDPTMGGQMDFVAGLAGKGSLFVDGLDAADACRVALLAGFFLETGPPTGPR